MEKKTDIVIIGAGLTGLTIGYYLRKAGKDFMIIEKSSTTGGVISTVEEDGFIFEKGPNTGVLSTPEIAALFNDLGNDCTLETGDSKANKRYILKNKVWTALPSGLFSAVNTPLFTLGDKLRILGEPFRKPGIDPDESVAGLVRRRLGKSFLDYAVNPFISGIYAGDPDKLVTRFALPKLHNLEHKYGSFIKGAIAKAKEPKSEYEKKATKEVFSVKGGLGNLITILTKNIGNERIITGSEKIIVNRASSGYNVLTENRQREILTIPAKHVITTAGAFALPSLLPFISSSIIDKITALEYAKVVQVSAGYKKWNGMKLDAFGGLVPEVEKRKILGILFPSAIFAGRAPEDGALLSVFMGGIRNPEMIDKNDNELLSIVFEEIRETMGATREPDLIRIHRYMHAIPQYDIKSASRLESIERIQSENPGLILAGNIRDGIGMADRVKQARSIADSLINR